MYDNLNKIELSEKSYILVLYVWKFSYQFLNIKSQFYKYESVTLLFGHPVVQNILACLANGEEYKITWHKHEANGQ